MLREDLRRCHEGGLAAGLDREQDGTHGDEGFSGADVPLQEPVHRAIELEVGADLADRAPLGPGEWEGEAVGELFEQLAGTAVSCPGERLLVLSALGDIELQGEEFFESEEAAGIVEFRVVAGEMDLAQCPGAVPAGEASFGRIEVFLDR